LLPRGLKANHMKKYLKIFIIALFVFFIIPQMAFAAWWNPGSWGIWNWFKGVKVENKNQTEKVTPDISKNNTVQSGDKEKGEANNTKKGLNNETTSVKTEPKEEQGDVHISPKTDNKTDVVNDVKENKPQDPRKIAIDELLKNPTFENYKAFCLKAKGSQGIGSVEKLDANREKIISVPLTLYESIRGCKRLDNGEKFTVYTLPDNNLYLPLKGDDTDLVRKTRIMWNDKLSEISKESKFLIFRGINSADAVWVFDLMPNLEYWLAVSKNKFRQKDFYLLNFLEDPMIEIRKLNF